MIDGALFDALEALARGIRGKQEPFGGIQLILAGQKCSTLSAVSSLGVLSAAQFFLYAGGQIMYAYTLSYLSYQGTQLSW